MKNKHDLFWITIITHVVIILLSDALDEFLIPSMLSLLQMMSFAFIYLLILWISLYTKSFNAVMLSIERMLYKLFSNKIVLKYTLVVIYLIFYLFNYYIVNHNQNTFRIFKERIEEVEFFEE